MILASIVLTLIAFALLVVGTVLDEDVLWWLALVAVVVAVALTVCSL